VGTIQAKALLAIDIGDGRFTVVKVCLVCQLLLSEADNTNRALTDKEEAAI